MNIEIANRLVAFRREHGQAVPAAFFCTIKI